MGNDINTNSKIRNISFKFFLEKGYEATNIREICKQVNIKPSSLYFYYNSKQELFLSIYDDIWNRKILYMKNIIKSTSDFSPEQKFFCLYKKMMDYYEKNIAFEKFLLRYQLFPAEELTIVIKDRYKYWTNIKNNIIIDLINQCIDMEIIDTGRNPSEYLQDYNQFESYQLLDMLLTNMKVSLEVQDLLWDKFWNCKILNNNSINYII